MQLFKKKYNNEEALKRIQRFCVYQDRCHKEVNEKLYEWGFDSEDRGHIVIKLIEQGFLNEERFAKAFIRGKFRLKKWGKIKIVRELKQKGMTDKLISLALKEIDDKEYLATLKKIIVTKANQIKEENHYKKMARIAQFAAGKGFEQELIWDIIRKEFDTDLG
jgi:regulatory protein